MSDDRRVVLITGCPTGIGRACVEYLAARDWRVIATARRIEIIRDLATENIDVLKLDVADESSRVRAIELAMKRTGRIDALVNNAGYSQAGPLAEVTLDEMHAQFETNLFGMFHLAQLVIPEMRKHRWGRIVNVSSIVGRLTFPYGGLYSGTKWAIEAMSDTLRIELKPWDIYVSVIEPGGVITRFGETANKYLSRYKSDPNSAYRAYLQHSGAGFREAPGIGNVGASPEIVARVIHRALTDRVPRPRYQATIDAWLAWPLLPLIPDWLKDFVIARMFGLNKK